ncbi:hypothetical protein [Nocardioides aquiterrae]|uniref:Universal stress protein n=1 Tax=Nocardioides aquiterrae TaxID=203799 RepID=A0ABP4F246_9ACTN
MTAVTLAADQRAILVVVPDGDAEALLRYATWEALLHGCALHLVHPHSPGDRARAERRVAAAVADAELMAGPGVPVEGRATPGTAASSELAAAGETRLVVVRRQDAPALLADLAGAAPALAAVPPGWTLVPDDRRPVLLGVSDPARARALVACGLEIARVHETSLRVLYAWHAPDSYEAELLDEARGSRSLVLSRTAPEATICRVLPESPCPVVLLP